MVWEVIEKSTDEDGLKEWALFVVLSGKTLQEKTRPFVRGWWFHGRDPEGDPHGKRLYEEGKDAAKQEAERLNSRLSNYLKSA